MITLKPPKSIPAQDHQRNSLIVGLHSGTDLAPCTIMTVAGDVVFDRSGARPCSAPDAGRILLSFDEPIDATRGRDRRRAS